MDFSSRALSWAEAAAGAMNVTIMANPAKVADRRAGFIKGSFLHLRG